MISFHLDGLAEEIARDGHNVLSVLEDLGKIDIERLDHFKHLMQDIQRSDLQKYINEFQKNMKEGESKSLEFLLTISNKYLYHT